MAISKIIVNSKVSSSIIDTKFGIKSTCDVEDDKGYTKGISLDFSKENNYLKITNHDGFGIYKDAADKISQLSYISTINGVEPSHDGSFFILGSECDSVWSVGNDIYIEDLCPTCTSCGDYMLLLKHIEYYKMLINYIKDINLYTDSIARERYEWLQANRVSLTSTCIDALDEALMQVAELPSMHGVEKLMKEYVSAVHMWNYAVNMNGARTQIISAPGEPSGFVAQTLRSLPSCKGNLSVEVTIDVTGPSTCNDDYLSMYVPEPEVNFLPEGSVEGLPSNCTIIHDKANTTTKKIVFSQANIEGAGSLCITARFLPFTAMRLYKQTSGTGDAATWKVTTVDDLMYDLTNGIIANSSTSVKDDDVTTTTTDYFLNIKGESYPTSEPTLTEYNDARRYPSITKRRDPLQFVVVITWNVKSDCPEWSADLYANSETYYFDCRPLRKCITDLWKNVTATEKVWDEEKET